MFSLLRLGLMSLAVVACGCGGSIADVPASNDPAQRGATPEPEQPPTALPPSAPPPSQPSKPPASALPTGQTTHCGVFDGDTESNLAAFGKARAVATYEVVAVVEECSGAGGLHVTLKRRSGCASASVVHFGEHACYSNTVWAVGDRAVVGVAPEAGSVTGGSGWCLEDVAPWDGVARAIRKLATTESEAQVLAGYGCVP